MNAWRRTRSRTRLTFNHSPSIFRIRKLNPVAYTVRNKNRNTFILRLMLVQGVVNQIFGHPWILVFNKCSIGAPEALFPS